MGLDVGGIMDGAVLVERVPSARSEDVFVFKNALGRAVEEHLAKV
ncbi:hypothetical protein BH20ACT10_BH20ACT10_22400 [soil metagenome]